MRYTKKLLVFSFCLLILFSLSSTGEPANGTLERISFSRTASQIEFILDVIAPYSYRSFALHNPNRFVVDLMQVTNFSCESYIEVADFGIKGIRVAKNSPTTTRVVFDLAPKTPSYRMEKITTGLKIVFWYDEVVQEKVVEKPKPAPTKKTPEKPKPKPVEKAPEKAKAKPTEKAPISLKLRRTEPTPEQEEAPEEPVEKMDKMFYIGVNAGFYFFHSAHFQDIYGKSSPYSGGELLFAFPIKEKEYMGVSAGFIYVKKNGSDLYSDNRLKITPVSFGALYLRQFGVFSPYISVGLDYFNYSENSPQTYEASLISEKTFGANIHVGTFISLTRSISLRVFGKYHSARLRDNQLDLAIGGNEYGATIFYQFNF